MGRGLNKFITALVRPPLEVIGFIFGNIYRVLFGWYDVKLSREREDVLAQDIRQDLQFLFDQGGRIVPDVTLKHPRAFDYAVVIVVVEGMFFRFMRGRGELRAQFAYQQSGNWSELPWLLSTIGVPDRENLGPSSSLKDVAKMLTEHMCEIREAFASARRLETEQQLSEIRQSERVAAKQLEVEINRRVYGSK